MLSKEEVHALSTGSEVPVVDCIPQEVQPSAIPDLAVYLTTVGLALMVICSLGWILTQVEDA